ncbi:MAG: hypothetical protein US68_C0035G0003 [Candidatus Shapirobacteria bacterium GW2011_GWE1_38_10]|uniref:Uncharacterized protein n=1 Tax=Candidatus Shapirobacteria bacterium GW2011_GWE1_38_10 TaxID=1618488 RepID=A0A0G0KGP8_9BACT|nr:MAG: hypothetical protein US68_C0035G0003 [Candidatus Shapirobacteria bacterium GW2011_GWE1_38_10]
MSLEQEQKYFPEIEMRRNNVPCWYEISLGEKAKYLQLKIHQDFIRDSKNQLGNDHLIEVLKERFNLGEFGTDFSENIGFGKIFNNEGKDEKGMIVFQAEIPKLGNITNKKCELCRGHDGLPCWNCYGTGKEITTDWNTARNFSASLTILTSYLAQPSIKTSANFPQLLTLETKTEHDQHGGSLWGVISLKLHNYINSLDTPSLNKISAPAMVASYQKMFFDASFLKRYFFAEKLENGGLALDCHGDRSGIFPDTGWHNNNEGYEFTCHNIDSPMQQIALIAGLAALHDAARKET